MRAYVVRRLLLAVVTVFLVSIIVFLMVRLIPGNIVDALIGQQMQIGETSDNREIEAARATIEKQLGLDVRSSNSTPSGSRAPSGAISAIHCGGVLP